MRRIAIVFAFAASLTACLPLPTQPTSPALPCDIYVRTDILPNGDRHVIWTNARGENCSPIQPIR